MFHLKCTSIHKFFSVVTNDESTANYTCMIIIYINHVSRELFSYYFFEEKKMYLQYVWDDYYKYLHFEPLIY